MRMLLGLIVAGFVNFAAIAENFEYKVYFGLSKKDGVVSQQEWLAYERDFAKQFTGFTVTAAEGYYLGTKEHTRVITLYMDDCREPKLEELVRSYVQKFEQDSVLVAKNELDSWKLVKKASVEPLQDTCETASDPEAN